MNRNNCFIYPPLAEQFPIYEIQYQAREMTVWKNLNRALLKEARIDPDFNRNSGETASIWGKWLQSKLMGKKSDEIESRMREFASKMPRPDEAIKQLEDNAADYRTLEYSKENWEKEFPENETLTPLGPFSFGKDFYNKLAREKREDILGLIKPTLATPEYIFVDKEYGTLFVKGFRKEKAIFYSGVLKDIGGESLFISFHQKGNIENKFKNAKMMVYKNKGETKFSDLSPVKMRGLRRAAGTAVPGFIVATDTGRVSFSVNNIQNNEPKSNETWVLFKSPGNIVFTTITYKVDGFEWTKGKKSGADTYDNINDYRQGILLLDEWSNIGL